ncbi:prolyl oligopeptidase family serine peptidase [Fusobacterium sp.]|uniref:prolyl oligopeptidase family serine peptidase n=1 Tax=Fusobacterium sp. TaxID=68766 RepID=UPI00396CDCAB
MKNKLKFLLFGIVALNSFGADYSFDVIGEIFDYGPQTTEVVLNFDRPLVQNSIDNSTFEVFTEEDTRKVTGVEFLDEKTVVLKLEHGQDVSQAALLHWDDEMFTNIEKPVKYSVKQNKNILTKKGNPVKIDENSFFMKDLKVKDLDKFGFGEKYGLKYRDYKPMPDNKKHPLIIWLHGAGEGGKSNVTQILGNRGGVAFVEEEAQQIFDYPYVLAPQSPTFWMQSFMVGDRELIGEKDYTPDLIKLIKEYIKENPQIDRDRIYIGGCSMGGYQSFKAMVADPELFAAAFISCPAYEPSKDELDKIKDIPVWLVHAQTDTTVPVSNSRNSYKYLKNIGSDVVYTEYKDVVRDGNKYNPHGSYFYTLHNDPVNSEGTHIFQWLASKKKK